MESDDDNSIFWLDVDIDDDQPAPGTDQGSAISPNTSELLPGSWELLQYEQRTRQTFPRIGWKLPGLDQTAKLITRLARDLDSRHWH